MASQDCLGQRAPAGHQVPQGLQGHRDQGNPAEMGFQDCEGSRENQALQESQE